MNLFRLYTIHICATVSVLLFSYIKLLVGCWVFMTVCGASSLQRWVFFSVPKKEMKLMLKLSSVVASNPPTPHPTCWPNTVRQAGVFLVILTQLYVILTKLPCISMMTDSNKKLINVSYLLCLYIQLHKKI